MENEVALARVAQREFGSIKVRLQDVLSNSNPVDGLRELKSKVSETVQRHVAGNTLDMSHAWDLTRPEPKEEVNRRLEAYRTQFGGQWTAVNEIDQVEAP